MPTLSARIVLRARVYISLSGSLGMRKNYLEWRAFLIRDLHPMELLRETLLSCPFENERVPKWP